MGSACAPIRICIVATPNRLRHSSDLILENYGAAYRGRRSLLPDTRSSTASNLHNARLLQRLRQRASTIFRVQSKSAMMSRFSLIIVQTAR